MEPQSPPPAALAPAAHVNRLLLLSEVAPGELRERVPPAPPPQAVVEASPEPTTDPQPVDLPAPPPEQVCYSVGPLTGEDQIGAMRDWLVEQGGEASLRVDERRELSLYWVYFPPLENRSAAVERVQGMRAEGIEDIYIIPRGDMANAISLGVYSRRVSLDRRIDALRKKGYAPSIVPRYRTKRASWFDVQFSEDFRFPQDTFAVDFPTVEMSPVACGPGQIARDERIPYNSLGTRRRPAQTEASGAADGSGAMPTGPEPDPVF